MGAQQGCSGARKENLAETGHEIEWEGLQKGEGL